MSLYHINIKQRSKKSVLLLVEKYRQHLFTFCEGLTYDFFCHLQFFELVCQKYLNHKYKNDYNIHN